MGGTNGKGSAIAFMRSCLEAAGYRVHVYTSPHLVRFAERIRLAGRIISEEALEDVLAECEDVNGGEPITFFEITTAAALLAFARAPAGVLLMEVGLGGRLDATNVIERPLLTAIAPVSIDHTQYLGESLSGIAWEKAGILKPGIGVVVGPQPGEALRAIVSRAAEVMSPLALFGRDWSATDEAGRLSFRAGGLTRIYPAPALIGAHQFVNAGLALACLRRLEGFTVGEEAIARGLRAAEWPGRLQRLETGPLAEGLPQGWELWLDGGHNGAAGLALAEVARSWRPRPLHLVVGMLNTKSPEDFVGPLAADAQSIGCVSIPGEAASLSAEEISERLARLGFPAAPAGSVEEALERATHASGARPLKPGRVLVCGSLYLVGKVLAENGWRPAGPPEPSDERLKERV